MLFDLRALGPWSSQVLAYRIHNPDMATLSPQSGTLERPADRKGAFAYGALLVFAFLYFARPEDFILGLGVIPVAKITGGLALIGLIVGAGSSKIKKFPIELKLLAALFAWQCIGMPFAWYKSGALNTVLSKCSKTLIVAVLVSLVVTSVVRLRKLMFVQAAAVAVMTLASVLLYKGGRMGGVLGGVFDNPNDLAINIGINWPLCLMFMLRVRNIFKKLLWAVALVVLLRGLMLTFSRTGFLSIAVAMIFCVIEFGIRGKRRYLIALAVVGVLAAVLSAPSGYGSRLGTIFATAGETGDSQADREQLLKESLVISLHHPLFGLGAGNFQGYTQSWHVTHNTYTELTSECGIPALILFLFVIRFAFRNLSRVRKTQLYAESDEVRLFTGALWASLAGYLVGAFFASTAYELFPYFTVAYTTALYNISIATPVPAPVKKTTARLGTEAAIDRRQTVLNLNRQQ